MSSVSIQTSWDIKSASIAVLTEGDVGTTPKYFAALGTDGNLYKWSASSNMPEVLAHGKADSPFEVDSLYLAKQDGNPYVIVRDSAKIHCYNLTSGVNTGNIDFPSGFSCKELSSFWSPRLTKTLLIAQGTYKGYSGIYYGQLDPKAGTVDWTWWGYYFVKKPVIVEGGKTLWAFCPYGYYADWEYLCYCWCYTDKLKWGDWHSMSYIGSDYHINSLAGGTARDASGGYALATTNAEGAHLIVANGTNDAYPKITSQLIESAPFKGKIDSVTTCTFGNQVMFFYLENSTVYAATAWPKEHHWSPFPEPVVRNATCIATIAEVPAVDHGAIYPLVYCDGQKTHLALWNATPPHLIEHDLPKPPYSKQKDL